MTQRRKAEAGDVRRWDREVAAHDDLDEVREWVVWGVGLPRRDEVRLGGAGNDLAETIARERDPDWGRTFGSEHWVVILRADEDDVDEWTREDDRVHGYAPYLVNQVRAEAAPGRMRGTLRPDVVERRPFDAGRAD